jgi:tetratricopeptide (TPR) repeat protein
VGGMPLALELAAGWTELLPMEEIAAEIGRSLAFLETDLQDIPDRHRSMQTIFDSTWTRLEPAEQELMEKLSVFWGGFTRQAAGQVAGDQESPLVTLKRLGQLVNKSLLQIDSSRQRYQIHELLRQYALERLKKSGELESTRSSHASYYLNLLHKRESEIKGRPAQREALDEIEADIANIRSAWNWALSRGNLKAIDKSLEALFWFFWFHSRQFEGVNLFLQAHSWIKESSSIDTRRIQRRVLGRLIFLDGGANLCDPAEKLTDAERILAESHKEGDTSEIAFAFNTLGHAQIDYSNNSELNYSDITKSFEQSLSIYRELNDHFYVCQVLDWLSAVYFTSGKPDERVKDAEQRLEIAQKHGDQLTEADALAQIAVIDEMTGHYSEAGNKYEKALPVFRKYGVRWQQAEYQLRLAGIRFIQGELDLARSLAEQGQILAAQYNIVRVKPHIKEHISFMLCAEENYEQAVNLSPEVTFTSYPPTAFGGFKVPTYANCGLGNFPIAVKGLARMVEMSVFMKAPGWQVQCLPAAALIAASENRLERAAELLSLAYHHPAGATGWLDVFPLVTRLRARLETELPEGVLAEAWERGKILDLDETMSALLPENAAETRNK